MIEFKSPLLIAICITLILMILSEAKRFLLFYPNKEYSSKLPDKVTELFVQGRKQNRICTWYYSASEGAPIVLFAHGNAGNISNRIHIINECMSRGISICIFDYRGYGKSSGRTNMDTMFHDMEDVYKYLIYKLKHNPEQIVIAGESIGSYPAAKLANKYQCKKLLLLYGLHSLSLTTKKLYPLLYPFIKLFISKDLRVYKELETYNGNTLILHSKEDEIVDYSNALENSKIKSNGNIQLVTIKGGHNAAIIDWEIVNQFVKEY
jgi:uncharacterized protein